MAHAIKCFGVVDGRQVDTSPVVENIFPCVNQQVVRSTFLEAAKLPGVKFDLSIDVFRRYNSKTLKKRCTGKKVSAVTIPRGATSLWNNNCSLNSPNFIRRKDLVVNLRKRNY